MHDRRIIVFRSRLRDGIGAEYAELAGKMSARAAEMPGYVAAKAFTAADGERLTLVEWEGDGALAAWRDEPAHREAQTLGRTRFYAQYRLDTCRVVRTTRFDGEVRTAEAADPAAVRAIGERWLACFAARDLDGLLALYAEDATHTSPKIRVRHPETGGLLRGKPALRAWWQDSFDRLPSLRYAPTALTADAHRVVMEYVRHLDGEPDLPVAEVLEIEAGRIARSRVFHG